MSKTPAPDLIRAFGAVMRTGSLSAASRRLGQSQPTVRRHIETLERVLDVQLFTRAGNGLTPTALAHELLPIATSVTDQAQAFARAASAASNATAGTVRLSASRVIATHVMPQVLTALQEDAPDIRIELTATDATENLLHRAADIAIRMAEPTQGALLARKLPTVPLGLFASPSLVQHPHLNDISQVPFVSGDQETDIERGMTALGLPAPGNVVLRSDDALVQIAHIQAGLGVGVCQVAIARRLGLVPVVAGAQFHLPCYVVMHEDQAGIRRIRHVFDHLVRTLPRYLLAEKATDQPIGKAG